MTTLQNLDEILSKAFPATTNWQIKKTKDGKQKESFIAESSESTVFIKIDTNSKILQRVGEIHVAPTLIASGQLNGKEYTIQHYIEPHYPTRDWLNENNQAFATTIKTYHNDEKLKALIQKNNNDPQTIMHQDLETLVTRWNKAPNPDLHTQEFEKLFTQLQTTSSHVSQLAPVPVHTDPNTKNMLVHHANLLLIDWDEVTLSHPLRDLGIMLWWYFYPENWKPVVQSVGLNFEEVHKDIYWWSAYVSLAAALWHIEHNAPYEAFIRDFNCALNKEPNPEIINITQLQG